ncbi:MAG: hypothetical protein U0L71_05470 [Eggerthellaceae bacterium]|nr:hypothetical protein [Eggerthellaceae bacterium]
MSAELTFDPEEHAAAEHTPCTGSSPIGSGTKRRVRRTLTRNEGLSPSSTRTDLLKRSISFIVEAAILLVVIYVFGRFSEQMPSLLIACIWAIASASSAVALAYPRIIRKKNTKEMFLDNSFAARRINGRIPLMIACYALSAILVASLMMQSQKWGRMEFIIAAASIPLFLAVALVADYIMRNKVFKPKYRLRGTVITSRIVVGILLTLIFAGIAALTSSNSQQTIGQAFAGTTLLFENAQSALLVELGKLNYLLDGYTAFGLSQLQPLDLAMYWIVNILLFASSAFGLAQLLSVCYLNRHELLEAFRPIEERLGKKARNTARLQTACVICLGSVVLAGSFMYTDWHAVDFRTSNEYSAAEQFVQKTVDINVYEFNGKIYEKSTVDNAIDGLVASNPDLAQQRSDLIQSLENLYTTYEGNIDGYLDWYYRSGWEKLQEDAARAVLPITSLFGATAPIDPTLQEKLSAGLDTAQIEFQIQQYNDALLSLRSQVEESLAGKELTGIPRWLINSQSPLTAYFTSSLASTSLNIVIPDKSYEDRKEHWLAIHDAIASSKHQTLDAIQSNSSIFDQHGQPTSQEQSTE